MEILAKLCVAQKVVCCFGEGGRGARIEQWSAHCEPSSSPARTSAMCMVRTLASAAMQSAVDVQQATVVAGGNDLGVGAENSIEFFIEHRTGDVGVLDGEGAAETATLLDAGEWDEIDVGDRAKKRGGSIAELERTQSVATGVISNAMREDRAEVGDAEALR